MRESGVLGRLREMWGDQLFSSIVAAIIVLGALAFYVFFFLTHLSRTPGGW